MSSLGELLSKHPITLTLALFVLSSIVSMYGQDLRALLHSRIPGKARTARRDFITARLRTLRRTHDSSYELVWFITKTFTSSVVSLPTWSFAVVLLSSIVERHLVIPNLSPLLWGTLIGPVVRIDTVLNQLAAYEVSVSTLESELSLLNNVSPTAVSTRIE